MKKRKRKKRRAKRILGNDRGLMFICKDIRRRWCQYGENRAIALKQCLIKTRYSHIYVCDKCTGELNSRDSIQIDHIVPMGPRPRTWEDIGEYARRMFETDCQALCKSCHKEKTDAERNKRKNINP